MIQQPGGISSCIITMYYYYEVIIEAGVRRGSEFTFVSLRSRRGSGGRTAGRLRVAGDRTWNIWAGNRTSRLTPPPRY